MTLISGGSVMGCAIRNEAAAQGSMEVPMSLAPSLQAT
jgi:hypothetical protein